MTTRSPKKQATPFLELRVGGLHLTVRRVPHRLLAFAAALAGSGATWILR